MGKKIQVVDRKDDGGKWLKSYMDAGVQCTTKSYKLWTHMKDRCTPGGYYQKRRPTYIGCTYSENFHSFQYFAEWCNTQVGYGCKGWQLDKDLLAAKGVKFYSEDMCVFVPGSLNMFMAGNMTNKSGYAKGVGAARGKFYSQAHNHGKRHLGYFDTEVEAAKAYATAKTAEARRWHSRLVAGEFIVDPRIIELLRTWEFKHGNT